MPPDAFVRRYRVRKLTSAAMTFLCALSVVVALVPLAFILFFVLRQG
ncbi:MAG: phosphate ABC transporter, permease protein PstA, partial [Acidobacteria bacterium]